MGKKYGLFRYADGIDKLLLLFGVLGSIGDGLMTPINMYILSGMINSFGSSGSSVTEEVVNKYTLRLMYCAVGVGLSAFLEGLCWTRTAERQVSRMRLEYLKSILRQEVSFFENRISASNTFQVVSTITSDAHVIQDAIAHKIPNCLANLSTFFFCFVVAFRLSWQLALAALPFQFMFVVPGLFLGRLMKGIGEESKDAYNIAGGIAEQAISSIRVVYSYVGEHHMLRRFVGALERNMKLGVKEGLVKGMAIGTIGISFMAWGFQAWFGSVLVTEKGQKGGAVFIAGLAMVLGAMGAVAALPNLPFIVAARNAAEKIYDMIDQIPGMDSQDKGKALANLRGNIEFKEVEFSYPSRPDTPVLQKFNLQVHAGKSVALVGGSGSGKSTVIALLERFYEPIDGEILLDGRNIQTLQVKWLRSQMGLVNQEPILFATSIKENILFGLEGASMELVEKASKAANAHEFISKLPNQYETQVGQFGFQLSGGQKQRIAIARALIRDPKILLLDEATSALDSQSEKIVQEALDHASQGRTTIIIAHRLSTIRDADLIAVLDSGRVIESGSHDELRRMGNGGGVYRKMVELQQSTTQVELSNGFLLSQGRTHQKLSGGRSPQTPGSMRSSYQNSPTYYTPEYAFSPAFSISVENSFQMDSFESQDNGYMKYKSYTPYFLLWRLARMNVPEWKKALLGCFGATCFGALPPIYSYCLGSVASVYFLEEHAKIKSEIKQYCFVFLGLGVAFFFTSIIQHHSFAIMGERLVKRVREGLLQKLLTFEISWFDKEENTSAAICARLATEANMFRSYIADRMSLLVQAFSTVCIAFAIGLIVAWKLALVMIALQPLLIASFYFRSVLMRSMSKKAIKAQGEGSQIASEAVVNHRTITAFSSQKRILNLYRETMRGPQDESTKQSWYSGFGMFSSQFLTVCTVALTFWYGGRLMMEGKMDAKSLFQAFFVLMTTGKCIADAGSMTSDLAKGSGAIKAIFATLDRRTEIDPEMSKGTKPSRGQIELKDVFFAYPARPEQMVFKGLSLVIEAGKTMALVGQSGSGKSTVIGLIERFYDPQKGLVLIDGRDIKSYNLRKLRSHFALVSQEPTLFAGTIRENIAYGKEEATEAEIQKATTLANAHEFISSLKDGYETYCGERGTQLSGGQKQRVALARAILRNPKILLLDEATSALDSASEALVQEALEKMMEDRTCVIVAHRLSTVQKADNIAVIKNGKVAEKGSHSTLLALGSRGAYYSLIKLQNGYIP